MGMSAPAEKETEPLQPAGDGAAPACQAAVAPGDRPARATGPPAAAAAGSLLALGLVPCEPRVPALDLAAVAADRAHTGEPEGAPCRQGHPPQREAAPPRLQGRGPGPATESLLFPGLTLARPRRSLGGGRAGGRAGGGGKAAHWGTPSSSTAATDAGA
ncbi:unnamed protein product [Prorocentrum cordatum]|uniref:Uncharacterized protein n=1 Tax=Prorocentrum cordatum TaxID=2364126 RepID=A0ABN9T7V2_9DINO|nr:unnamed protein product [Polarella glacialis]